VEELAPGLVSRTPPEALTKLPLNSGRRSNREYSTLPDTEAIDQKPGACTEQDAREGQELSFILHIVKQ